MLCAAWELYAEEVALEAIDFLVACADEPHFLPNRVKGKISQAAKNDKHDFGVLKLSGDGWKKVYRTSVKEACKRLNTPKFGELSNLYQDWLGIEADTLDQAWRHDRDEINKFVQLRGEIAHRGADAPYIRIRAIAFGISDPQTRT